MPLIAAGLVTLLGFVALSEAARVGVGWARSGAVAISGLLAGLAASGVFVGLMLLWTRCDESCDENLSPDARSGHWWNSLDAWQWWAQALAAALGCGAVVAARACAVRGSYRLAAAMMVLAAAFFALWTAFLAPLGERFGI